MKILLQKKLKKMKKSFFSIKNAIVITALSVLSTAQVKAQTLSVVAGTGGGGYSGDYGLAINATFHNPGGCAVDAVGNIYIADINNYVIRKVNHSTGIITTYVGTGSTGVAIDGVAGTSSPIRYALQLATDNAGNFDLQRRMGWNYL